MHPKFQILAVLTGRFIQMVRTSFDRIPVRSYAKTIAKWYGKIRGSRLRKPLTLLFYIFPVFVVFIFADMAFPVKIHISYSTVITDSGGEMLHAYLSSDEKWRLLTELDEITPAVKKAIVYKEDRYFYYHFGINPVAVCRALIKNIARGKRTSGASTITMQAARLLEPRSRTYLNKLIEMFRALQLEWHLSKNEILQLYLNLLPYGGNIEGVKAASLMYFNKMPDHLSIGEIAVLSIIPNNPNILKPGEDNALLIEKRNRWLERYRRAELFPDRDIDDAENELLKGFRYEVPRYAHHFSQRLYSANRGRHIIRSTLCLETQLKVESLVREHTNRWYFRNVKNAAALVIDNRSGSIVAYAGSADFFNTEDGGQVDGIRAVRSPGSTLKPLIYGLAFDKGLITPKTVVSDVPVYFSGYEPENYDGKYHGLVNIDYALSNSLNVPAVKIMNELKVRPVVESLIKAGFSQIRANKDHLGLSVALGGCGVTLEELTTLYFILSNKGEIREIRDQVTEEIPVAKKKNKSGISRRLLTEEAAYMVTDILTKVTRPDLPTEWENTPNLPKVAWKTGTSYGRRDAWSIGYNKRYTIGVWVGNFSGEGVPGLSGADAAAPLLFSIFNALDYGSEENWYEIPQGLESRIVCSATGNIPSEFCTDLVVDYYIPAISPVKPCEHMKQVFISPDSTISYCTGCRPDLGYIKALYPNYSAEMIAYYEEYSIHYEKIPPHNLRCERVLAGSAPVITSPLNNAEYYVDETDSMQIALCCNAAGDVEEVFWFINMRFYCSVPPTEKVFFNPSEGFTEISCSDDKGRNTDVNIRVKKIGF